MKILMTGGHITPALAVLDECKGRNIDVVFVGRAKQNGTDVATMESKMLDSRGVRLIHLDAGRLTRVISVNSLKHLFKIPRGFALAYNILKREQPDCILSFGGYIALPIAFFGWLSGTPVYTHEQVLVPGITSRIIALFAKIVFVSFKETCQYFPEKKLILSGNPIRKSVFEARSQEIKFNPKKPVLYITGGSLGAHAINTQIETILPQLLERFVVIHQTGNEKTYGDYERLSKLKLDDYYVYDHVLEDRIGYFMKRADLVVSRSGANTVFELLALHRPSVLIPLPYSGFDEQMRQAKLLEKYGVAVVVEQKDIKSKLLPAIYDAYRSVPDMKNRFHNLESYIIKDASTKILDTIVRQNSVAHD